MLHNKQQQPKYLAFRSLKLMSCVMTTQFRGYYLINGQTDSVDEVDLHGRQLVLLVSVHHILGRGE